MYRCSNDPLSFCTATPTPLDRHQVIHETGLDGKRYEVTLTRVDCNLNPLHCVAHKTLAELVDTEPRRRALNYTNYTR